MIGTITFILSRAGYRAMNGPLADERRRLAGAEPPAAYVSYDPRLLAGAGWYGYRIALKGGDRQMVERARYMLSERYVIRDGYEYYADGVYVFGVLLRERVPHYGIGGGAEPGPSPIDEWWGLKLTMPEGGTVILRKNGGPNEVSLEVSTDAVNWQPWTLVGTDYSYTLEAGETLCIRNTSSIAVPLSSSNSKYYNFSFNADIYASGQLISLLVKNSQNLSLAGLDYCFYSLFNGCDKLLSMPELSAITGCSPSCLRSSFQNCFGLTQTTLIPDVIPAERALQYAFYGCSNLIEVKTLMTNISASNFLANWLNNVAATGDFYCPAELTIPTGVSGIPSGWTRHDI